MDTYEHLIDIQLANIDAQRRQMERDYIAEKLRLDKLEAALLGLKGPKEDM